MTETLVPNGGYAVASAHATAAAQALGSGGEIDETAISYANMTSANLNPVSDILTVFSGATPTATVQLAGSFQSASLGLSSDGAGGTEIVDFGVSPQVNDPISPAVTSQQTVILAGSNLQFVNTYASSVGQGYENAIVTAENFYQSQIATTATLDFKFDMAPGVAVGTNSYTPVTVSFSSLENALSRAATSADDKAAVAAIAASSGVFTGSSFQIADPLAQLLGLPGAAPGAIDTTELNSTLNYFYNQAAPVPGAFDAVATLEHEISEGGFGRIGGDGSSNGIVDLFRYAAAGRPDITLGQDGSPAYFSVDGTQLLTEFHNPISFNGANDGADSADWDASGTGQTPTYIAGQTNQYDAFGVAPPDEVGVVTPTDLRLLDVLGWTLSSIAPVTTVSSGQTVTISAGQVDSGLTVESGGVLNVASGGTAEATVVSGGLEFVLGGGLDSGATLEGGGEQVVSSGAAASGVSVQSGGFQLVRSNGYSSGTTVASGGLERFYSGASATNLVLSSGATLGTELVVVGATSATATSMTATSTTVVSGVTVLSGGTIEVQAATVDSGGVLALPAGADLAGLTTVSAGGVLSGPGSVTGDLTDYGLVDGGVVGESSTGSKGYAYVEAGASASGLVVADGGVEYVLSGGAASATTISDGGELVVDASAQVSGLALRAGATVDLAGVLATSASVNASGQLVATSAGVTQDTIAGVAASGLTFGVASDGAGGTILTARSAADDFNGDGLSDFLWRNTNGDTTLWLTNAGSAATGIDVAVVPSSWTIQAAGDFNGDGKADILWRNSDGDVSEWLSTPGSGFTGFTGVILANVDPSWVVQSVGDFTGNGLSDILWRNANGDTTLWLTNAGGAPTGLDLGVIPSSWTIQGVGDLNGDGKADILWRNSNGDVSEWLSKPGSGFTGFTGVILANVDPSWRIASVGDFNGDGLSDFLWRNTNGDTTLWLTNVGAAPTGIDLGSVPTSWTIQGVGDFNGDGKADILWRNSDGDVSEWLSKPGSSFTGFTGVILANVDPSWQLQAKPPALQQAAAMAQAMATMGGTPASTGVTATSHAAAAPLLIAAPKYSLAHFTTAP